MKTFFAGGALLALLAAPAAAQDPRDHVIVGGRSTYTVTAGETLASVAGRLGVTAASLIELNGLALPFALSPGQAIAVDNPHIAAVDRRVAITINVAQRMLFLREGERVFGYPVTVGRRTWPTPLGAFTITEKEINPAWDVPVSIQHEMLQQGKPAITRMAASPQNPLGAFWMRLSLPGLGIHGTNAPSSIYRYASHGCIRMHPAAIEELFGRVEAGAAGVLVYQPIIIAVVDGRVWLEAHPDEYRRAPDAKRHVRDLAGQYGLTAVIDWDAVDLALRRRAGRAEDVTLAISGHATPGLGRE